MSKVIVNSTPMIILSKIGMISVLHDLFGEVIIPQAVYDERANEKKQLFY